MDMIDMVERANARILDQNPTSSQLTERLGVVTAELADAYRTIDRLRAECQSALDERDRARYEEAYAGHEICDADLEAQKRATWNARVGERIAAAAAIVCAAIAIAQAFI
ncbi:MAG TPA: hypothetical protein VKZ65_12110 [Glycomyces sp.]|nr:hypothetical protein [Glycomyces sp.]